MLHFVKKKLFITIEVALLVFVVIAYTTLIQKKRVIEAEIDSLQDKLIALNDERDILHERLQKTDSDTYTELEAKRKLNYKRKDETVLIFYNKEQAASNTYTLKEDITSKPLSNPLKWFYYFFKTN